MKASELRIGNWVSEIYYLRDPGGEYKYFKDVQITANDFINDKIESFEPIPLTEERLVRLGFIKDGEGSYWLQIGRQEFSVRVCQEKDWGVTYSEDVGFDTHWLCFVEYIHQLQNLIFALTGKELKLNKQEVT